MEDPWDIWRSVLKDRLAELKRTDGTTQEDVATKLGLSQGTISTWVNAQRSPDTLRQFCELAEALGLQPAYLLFRVSGMTRTGVPSCKPDEKLMAVRDDEEQIVLKYRDLERPDRIKWLTYYPGQKHNESTQVVERPQKKPNQNDHTS